MKLFAIVFLAVAGLAAATSNTDVDPSTIRPLWEHPEWAATHPAHMEVVRKSGVLNKPYNWAGRIAGGVEASRMQFPYMAGLITHLTTGNSFCGGSLISSTFVLTAAHCLDSVGSLIAVLGAHNVFIQTEPTQQRLFTTSENFVLHAGYQPEDLYHDVAVIRLPEVAQYGDYIRSVRLPNWRQTEVTFAGQGAVISGWGRTQNWNSDLADALQFARVNIMTNLACRTRFPTSDILAQHVCADGGIGGPCTGDMGGPLSIVEADNVTTQIGIISFGLGLTCEASWPSVYMRITEFLGWIEDNTDRSISENW